VRNSTLKIEQCTTSEKPLNSEEISNFEKSEKTKKSKNGNCERIVMYRDQDKKLERLYRITGF